MEVNREKSNVAIAIPIEKINIILLFGGKNIQNIRREVYNLIIIDFHISRP